MMAPRRFVFGIAGLASIFVGSNGVYADFAAPITADPADSFVAAIPVDYTQTLSYSETLKYDSNFNSYPDIYWFKYVSDGKTAVKFDTLGSNFGSRGPDNPSSGGAVLGSYNESEIAVYNSSGTSVAIAKNTVDSSGNPIPIWPTYSSQHDPTNWYTPEGLSELYFKPNATSNPQWDVNPNDPTGYTGWYAPGNAGNSQEYYAPNWPTSLNAYHVWSTALSKVDLNNQNQEVLDPTDNNQTITQPGWRYSDFNNAGPASTWNQYNLLPAGTYYVAVSSVGLVYSGDTYGVQLLEAPIHYDSTGDEPNNGSLPEITQPLGNFQYYDDPTGFQYYGTIQLNVTQSLAGTQNQWNVNADGNWSNSTNWAGPVPQVAGDTAYFLNAIGSAHTIILDIPETAGHLVFDSTAQYTLGGSQTLTLSNGSNPADVQVEAGSHIISAPLLIASNTTIITSASTTLSINGPLSIAAGLTLIENGFGTVNINGTQTNGVGSAIYIGEGAANISTDPGSNVALTSTGTVNFPASTGPGIRPLHLASLDIGPAGLVNGVVSLSSATSHSNRTVLATSSLSITGDSTNGWQGQLDLGSNDLIVHNGDLPTITSQIQSGLNKAASGYWNGQGITSSAAATDATHLTALGVISNANGLYSTFDGQSVSNTDVLVKYTYFGDANLDGKVNGTDYTLIDNGFNTGLSGWLNGDFNYDGVINGDDYMLIDNAFNIQPAPLVSGVTPAELIATDTAQVAVAVPEPGNLSLLFLGTTAFCKGRRRRKHRTARRLDSAPAQSTGVAA
jgi:hypothetical protein